MLMHIPDVLTPAEVASMRDALAGAEWIDGRATVGAQGAQVKSNLQLADDSALRHRLGEQVLAALARNPLYFASVLPARTLPPRFNCYRGGGQYGFHVDGAVMALAASAGQATGFLRSDVSCTLFLNDPDDYDGGELVIHDTYGEHEVKLPAGDLIVYPSSSLHRVEPVTRGERLASFFWVQSLVRDETRRRLLLEMDRSIQSLTAANADREDLLRLTGVYHNLLRRWSEP
ncbi:Fe2+-dependent dioxygenase [Marilutibacter maris]|uniref:Fe(II)-dependent oxygenase n=1 Tax=Marilutibacter maris TaxID=1605891 RepID=A0A2U9T4S3_9GAMM|nr:Fe2+-dependent dioxygenase [Lysobacter maris]AWV06592.1 Fe(II)-dependent oxygenase [Lysobacter maris]KAB8188366.1 Fe2+-dependent dioxygenase [Lysobacter maris]